VRTNVVVLRDGEAVVELGDDELRDTYSVTKSIVSTLAGIALARRDIATVDPWRPLLTMTAGLQSEIDDVIALDSGWEDALQALPRRPAGVFSYDNGTAHVFACELAGHFGAGYAGQLLWVTRDAVVASNAGEAFVP
jgi:CubicO group peptidase (beta-lactamase class C family)